MSTSDNCWCRLKWSSPCNRAIRYMMWFLCVLPCAITTANEFSNRPGCYLVSKYCPPFVVQGSIFYRILSYNDIDHCVGLSLSANVCQGYCESRSIVTDPNDIKDNPNQVITSTSSCCDMDESEYIVVSVPCLTGFKNHTFRSAKSCKCSHCV